MTKSLRVLVVEDSTTIRKHLVEILSAQPDIEVVGEAADGREAIELCRSLRPDVMTMDMMLPVMSGVAATEYIMAYCPTPILIVSASVNRGEAFRTYEALAAGAVDVLDKPKADQTREEWERSLVSRLRMVARIKVITHPRGRLRPVLPAEAAGAPIEPAEGGLRAVAIGASTGGPAAVADILRGLPPEFPLPVLVVIHIAEQFAFALAEWLNTQSRMPVRYARDGEPLPPRGQAVALLAPAGRHLAIERERLRLGSGPERHSCRPSVDVLFESVARELGPAAVCCLLTGMGRDGAAGLLAARRAGSITIAQDEATSIVFGMPGEAVRIGAAERVLPLDRIAPTLMALGAATATLRNTR